MQGSSFFYRVFINSNIYSLLIIYTLIIMLMLAGSIKIISVEQTLLCVFAGILIWSFTEYLVHRFLFHGERKTVLLKQLQFFMHGYHHSRPRDPDRLVLPFILTLPIAIGLYFLLIWLTKLYANALCAGLLLGYIWYDVSHYAIHRLQPFTRFGKFRRAYHFHHHFKEHSVCFGVTTPLWDYVFGTTRRLN